MKRVRNEGNEIYRMHGVSLKVSPWRLWVQSAVLGVLVLILSLPAKAADFNVGSGNVVKLIEAINLANTNGEDDRINLEPGSYTLTQENNVTTYGSNGLPSITTRIKILGAGRDETIIVSGSGEQLYFRIFHVAETGNLTLEGVSVRGGFSSYGGGIFNKGVVTLTSTTIKGNVATMGGGIYNSKGTLTLINNTIIDANGSIISGAGGGIYNKEGTVTLENCKVINNAVADDSSGGGIYSIGGKLTLTNTEISHNECSYELGGGIFSANTKITLNQCTIDNNNAVGGNGGGVYIGFIDNAYFTPLIANCTISKNNAQQGGGIWTNGNVEIVNCTISENVSEPFDGIDPFSGGGGIFATSNTKIKNTIVANNSPGGNCVNFGTFTPFGVNMATDDTCLGFTSVTAEQLKLGPLENNGGPTLTHALLSGSVAIDAVSDCTDIEGLSIITDQRGVTRPQDGDGNGEAKCDIGAYEKLPTLKILSDNTWKSWNSQLSDFETLGFDDSGWRNAYAPYPYRPDYPPTHHISDTNAVYMWDYPDYPSKLPDGKDGPNQSWFRKIFDLSSDTWDVVSATVVVGADDDFDFYVNGELVHSDWDGTVSSGPFTVDIKPYLVKGKNVFAMYAKDSYGDWEWALVDATIEMRNLDFSNDGCVDRDDVKTILEYIRGPGPHYDLSFDLNGDGEVNIADARKLVTFINNP